MTVASVEASPRNGAALQAAELQTAALQTAALQTNDRWAGCVSVIVPVYNEIAHVDELLQAIHASPVKKEIIVVDDGSTDGTREKLQAMPLAHDATVVFHPHTYAKHPAIPTTLPYA